MRHPTRSLILGSIVILATLGFVVYQGLANNLVYYITPSELLTKQHPAGVSFLLGGQVKPGSVRWNAQTRLLTFVIRDPKAALRVVSRGVPPALFRPGAGVVVEGTYGGRGVFQATSLMIKHGNSYRAPKPGETPDPASFEGQ